MNGIKFFLVLILTDVMIVVLKSGFSESSIGGLVLSLMEFCLEILDDEWSFVFLDRFFRCEEDDRNTILDNYENNARFLDVCITHISIRN